MEEHGKPRWVQNVNSLNGIPISPTAPTSGQVLTYSGAVWAPAGASGSFLPLTGGTLTGSLTAVGITNSALTAGRVVYTGTAGLEQASANLTFDGNIFNFTAGTLSTGNSGQTTTVVLPSSAVAELGISEVLTCTGSGAFAKQGHLILFSPSSYTGSGAAIALSVANNSLSTGTSLTANTFNNPSRGSVCVYARANGSSTGNNIGVSSAGDGSSVINLGVIGKGVFTSATSSNVGTMGSASGGLLNTGGYFQISGLDTPTFMSAALIAEAGTSGSPIFLGNRNNGTTVFTVTNAGGVTATNVTDSALTSGRVPYASTAGLFVDSANMTFDGTNFTNAGTVTAGVGFASTINSNFVGNTVLGLNTSTGTAAGLQVAVGQSTGSSQIIQLRYRNSGFTTAGLLLANQGNVNANSGVTNGFLFSTGVSGAPIVHAIGGTAASNERFRVADTSCYFTTKDNTSASTVAIKNSSGVAKFSMDGTGAAVFSGTTALNDLVTTSSTSADTARFAMVVATDNTDPAGHLKLLNSVTGNFFNILQRQDGFTDLKCNTTTVLELAPSAFIVSGGLTTTINGPLTVSGGATVGGGTAINSIQTDTATLTAGTVTVSSLNITANSRILLTRKTPGGVIGIELTAPSASRTVGAGSGSFIINSVDSSGSVVITDTSTVDWLILN